MDLLLALLWLFILVVSLSFLLHRVGGYIRIKRLLASGICPLCRDPIGQEELIRCLKCNTAHHADCVEAGNPCSIFGCSGIIHRGHG
jgi:hypothetical protein